MFCCTHRYTIRVIVAVSNNLRLSMISALRATDTIHEKLHVSVGILKTRID
jgi:hypothetical protein